MSGLFRAIGASAIVASSLLIMNVEAASADAIQQNISGNVIYHGNVVAVSFMQDRLNSVGQIPAISLNEVCDSQAFFLAWHMASKGWTYNNKTVVGIFVGGDCGWYGAWTWAATGSLQSGHAGHYTNQANAELRGWACAPGGFTGTEFFACTTHLQPELGVSGLYKVAQFGEYRNIMNFFGSSKPLTASGDLYLTWSDIQSIQSNFFSVYKEGGRCKSPFAQDWTHKIAGTNKRVDHVFAKVSQACPSNSLEHPSTGTIPSLSYFYDHRAVEARTSVL